MPGLIFEISWEVCNKVGGIYTVVRSKAAQMVDRYKDSYFAVGPYFLAKSIGEFEEKPPSQLLKAAFDRLKGQGIVCHFGTWLVEGEPNAILLEYSGFTYHTNEIKRELWDHFKVDSLNTEFHDFDEPVVWSYAAGKLIEELSGSSRCLAHFHEWLSGAGLLYLKKNKANVASVFTTHATVLGRCMASANIDIYNAGKIDSDAESYRLGVHPKHQVERAAARNADVFTTVSEVTAIEAEGLLGRKTDLVLPNGLNLDKFPTFDEASIKHKHYKARIKEFITYYFFPYYHFNLNNTLIYFLSGRYEFHDKGVDIFIQSLGKLNERMKKEKSDNTIVAFFWVPGNVKGIKQELVENRAFFEDVKESIRDSSLEIIERLVYLSITQKRINEDELFGRDLWLEIRKKSLRLSKKGSPPLSTHDIHNEEHDSIISMFKSLGLNNSEDDRVKVVFYPIYLTGADRLLDLNYYEAMTGSHLGVFPSFYEPWGYTPLEAGALGVASVTTDLAGFGKYISKISSKNEGIFVIRRLGKDDNKVVDDLSDILYSYSRMTKEERIRNKIEAKRIASHADWKNFAKYYFSAHKIAMAKKWGS
ncbi:glycogen/starch synthase [Candidatus Woesearchaeota archaeon]|nr:glycogen/starch synthase [Candidatus Woesearchaeota archaeon]